MGGLDDLDVVYGLNKNKVFFLYLFEKYKLELVSVFLKI